MEIVNIINKIRRQGRRTYDSFYCKNLSDKIELGDSSSWFVSVDPLSRESVVYSAGAGRNISFELQLIQQIGCQVTLLDPSPTGVDYINSLTDLPELLDFFPLGIAKETGDIHFDYPDDLKEGSFRLSRNNTQSLSFPCISLTDLMQKNDHQHIDLLKMDIEGFEYGVIEHIVEEQIEIKQICVEFHHFMDGIPKQQTDHAIRQLKQLGYSIIHKRMLDYTFLKTK